MSETAPKPDTGPCWSLPDHVDYSGRWQTQNVGALALVLVPALIVLSYVWSKTYIARVEAAHALLEQRTGGNELVRLEATRN